MDIFWVHMQVGRVVDFFVRPYLKRIAQKSNRPRRVLSDLNLYSMKISPYVFRVRKYIATQNIEIELKDILESQVHFEELIRHGKVDQVPCLKIGASEYLYESKDIVRYLEKSFAN